LKHLFRRAMLLALALIFAALPALAEDYYIEVDITSQIVTIFLLEDDQPARIVRQMVCSTGDDTPEGIFLMPADQKKTDRGDWYYTLNVYVKWPTRILGDILFHSLPYAREDESSLMQREAALIGTPASHGCIRLYAEDALWIAEHCRILTIVNINERESDNAALRQLLMDNSYTGDVPYEEFLAGAAEYHIGADVAAIIADFDSKKLAIINITNNEFLNMRAEQDYESDLAGYVPDGGIVEVLEFGKQWSLIKYKDYVGYIATAYLVPMFVE